MMPMIPKITPRIEFLSTKRFKKKIEIRTSNIGTVPSRMATTPLSKFWEDKANKVNGKAELKKPTMA